MAVPGADFIFRLSRPVRVSKMADGSVNGMRIRIKVSLLAWGISGNAIPAANCIETQSQYQADLKRAHLSEPGGVGGPGMGKFVDIRYFSKYIT